MTEPIAHNRNARAAQPGTAVTAATSAGATPAERLRHLLDQPFVGFAPWILLSLVEGPHRLLPATASACGLAVALFVAGVAVGLRPKILDVAAIVFFGVLTAVAVAAGADTSRWLTSWASELSNIAIAVIAGTSLAVGRPFTIQYAKETTDEQYWTSPVFLRINRVITAVWSTVFGLIAIVGYIGNGPLHQPNNIWTNWIIQIGLVVVAVKFTAWYPDYATGDTPHRPHGGRHVGGRQPSELLRPLAAYLVPVGVLVMILAGSVWWIGAALIVVGVVASRHLRRVAPAPDAPAPPRTV